MDVNNPYQLLRQWQRRSFIVSMVAGILLILLMLIAYYYDLISMPIGIVICVVGISSIYYLYLKSHPNIKDALNLAHSQNPTIEFSGQLLLEKNEPLGLSLMQKRKVSELFGAVNYKIPWNYKMLRDSMLLITGLIIGGIAIQNLISEPETLEQNLNEQGEVNFSTGSTTEYLIDTTILKDMSITETPPSYTGLPTKTHSNADIQIAEGALVKWSPLLFGPINQLFFRFSASDTMDITKQRNIQKEFFDSDFYQYGFYSPSRNFVSDFHSVKVILDQKPDVVISGIEEYVRLPWQRRHDLSFDIALTDDYGLKEAYISATIAKGTGESVKFRERQFELKNYSTGTKIYNGRFTFQTDELGMEPGDELYFYIKANDNYPYGDHWTKSVTHIISIADTTTVEYFDDGGMQVDLMPDFFRSQRQIIIESEQLLKNKPFVSIDSFNRASNELGFDQKMLRLKYGQFLGEENESGITFNNDIEELDLDHDLGHDHDHNAEPGVSSRLESARDLLSQYRHDHDHEEEEGLLQSTKGTENNEKIDPSRPTWVEELSHNHDNTEEATFHGVAIKNKLRAALSVMWDAELYLRLYDPTSSLKFQYESLALLQEIKDHARIYVHRIGFAPPTIKEGEIRLKGDQDKIDNRLNISERVVTNEYKALKILAEALGSNDIHKIDEHLDAGLASLAKVALIRSEVLPVLSLASNINRKFPKVTSLELASLRRWIIKVIPEEAASLNRGNNYAHDLTLSVAKKMTN